MMEFYRREIAAEQGIEFPRTDGEVKHLSASKSPTTFRLRAPDALQASQMITLTGASHMMPPDRIITVREADVASLLGQGWTRVEEE